MRQLDETFEFDILKPRQDHPTTLPMTRRLLFLWRQKWIFLLCVGFISLFGAFYVLQRDKSYTAHSLLLVENTQLDPGRQELVPSMGDVDTSMVDTQVEIIKSDAIALSVIENINFRQDDESSEHQNWLSTFKKALNIRGTSDRPEETPKRAALQAFYQGLSVKRIGNTHTIDVRFTAGSPEIAAQVTNAVVSAYLEHQTAAARTAASSASAWLRDRIKDLGPKTRIISAADLPLSSDGPGKAQLLGAFIALGILFGISIAIARELLDTTLKDPLEAELKLQISFIGAITQSSRNIRSKTIELFQGDFNHAQREQSYVSVESSWTDSTSDCLNFDLLSKIIQAKALTAATDLPLMIGVASATPAEGSATTAFNLALSAASMGKRVLLVDGNGYQANLSRHLGRNSQAGLGDLIAGKTTVREVLRRYGERDLYFIPWADHPLAQREHERRAGLVKLFHEWKKDFDLIVFDLPPLLTASDAALLHAIAGSLLLVIRWGSVPSNLVSGALSASGICASDCLGFVFNKVPPSVIRQRTFPLEAYLRRHR